MNTEPLAQILAAKDEIARIRMQYAAKKQATVSLSLNVPGFPKSNRVTARFFDQGLSELKLHLQAHRIFIMADESFYNCNAAGEVYIVPVMADNTAISGIKQTCEQFEERHAVGRFIDVDVFDQTGVPVSSGKSKICFYCKDSPAIECRRLNRHEPDELRAYMFSEMERYCDGERKINISRRLSTLAISAALHEIALTPKPGLVDRMNNGSHSDMNFNTFMQSTSAIAPYFTDLVKTGFEFGDDFSGALPVIRQTGLLMEKAMFDATGGVNTQKGLIFAMGICLFGCGIWFRENKLFEADGFRMVVRAVCKNLVTELDKAAGSAVTHGNIVYNKFQVEGIRKEASEGFPTVFSHGLPILMKYDDLNDEALKLAFLAIASVCSDTNILFRAGVEVLDSFRSLASSAFQSKDDTKYTELIAFCNKMHISPGGSADLLALSIFFHNIAKEKFN